MNHTDLAYVSLYNVISGLDDQIFWLQVLLFLIFVFLLLFERRLGIVGKR